MVTRGARANESHRLVFGNWLFTRRAYSMVGLGNVCLDWCKCYKLCCQETLMP